MFTRVLFLLLLALNIGAGCWLYFMQPAARAEISTTDPGVPRLVLLSEREHDPVAKNSGAAGMPGAAADQRAEVCASLGPFSTQADLRFAMNALTPLVARIQYREAQTTELLGSWVYLPAPANRERALALARELSNKGVSDYYVVTAGDQPNTISLGVFRDPVNAEKRRSEISALGFKPEVSQRSDELPVYWIDYARISPQPLDWHAQLPPRMEVHEQPSDCF